MPLDTVWRRSVGARIGGGMTVDVIIVGAGNAAFAAAVAASQQGASVLMLERAPLEEAGGNTRFTAGAIRFAYSGADDLRRLMPDLTDGECARTDFGSYSEDQFFEDMFRLTEYRTDPDLCELLVRNSRSTVQWMYEAGLRFQPIWGRQAFLVDDKFKFWGGLTVEAWGGGPGLIEGWTAAAKKRGIEIRYGARVSSLICDDNAVLGVVIKQEGVTTEVMAKCVVLAAGGFQANVEWRTRYLGPSWDLAKVRGTRFATGDGLRMALEIGAMPCGQWSGCHAVAWERNAPDFGDLAVGDAFQKHSYPFGVMINANGERFVDEGAEFRNYTYAKYGREILKQPGQFAWQIFDAQVRHLLRDEYRIKQMTKVSADTLEDLVEKLDGVDSRKALKTLQAYNAAVRADIPFNPNVKDGRETNGLVLRKSNWANPLTEPPFEAYAVTCGITFTFGGVRINADGEVLDIDLKPIPGLYAAGEMVGGIFFHNYPGGAGLMSGAVFGKIAGDSAGRMATARRPTAKPDDVLAANAAR
jgi:tricarballylate dehydrogenase